MASANDLIGPLSALAGKCVEQRAFACAESLCNLLAAVDSDRWSRLPSDERHFWLRRLAEVLHTRAMGELHWVIDDPDYHRSRELTEALIRTCSD